MSFVNLIGKVCRYPGIDENHARSSIVKSIQVYELSSGRQYVLATMDNGDEPLAQDLAVLVSDTSSVCSKNEDLTYENQNIAG